MPGEQGRRGHRERLAPPAAGDQPRQGREPQPVGGAVPDPDDLAAQHHVLVPEHKELGILGHLTPRQHCQAAEEAAREQVANRDDHSVMVPADVNGRARSCNRAPQDEHQVRRWTSWYRWVTLAMLAAAFLAIAAAAEHARGPAPAGQAPLTRNEIAHLLATLTSPAHHARHRMHWSRWRRRHQHRARTCHYQRQSMRR